MKSSFTDSDCIFLLKDLTGIIGFTSLAEKEELIAKGVSYSEMIYEEKPVTCEVQRIFWELIRQNASELARYTSIVADQIFTRGGKDTVIVSLARAGSPIGALIKRYIRFKYQVSVPHYSISIIRGRGIDTNALDFIMKNHPYGRISFVDGWTGKGSITAELRKAISTYNENSGYNLSADLAVLADPAQLSAIAGTRRDVCIPNACLNSTISGLVSRTILNRDYIADGDFHGAVRYDFLSDQDVTNDFLDTIEQQFKLDCDRCEEKGTSCVDQLIERLRIDFPIADIHKVKLSIGGSSRALLRRIPYLMLVKDAGNPDLSFVLHLARQKGVEVRTYDTMNYECVTLLR